MSTSTGARAVAISLGWLIGLSAQNGFAAVITPQHFASARADLFALDTFERIVRINETSGPISIDRLVTAPNGDTFEVLLSAISGFGVLRAAAAVDFSADAPTGAFLRADAGFSEVMIVNFDPWNGRPGLLGVYYDIDGTVLGAGARGQVIVSWASARRVDGGYEVPDDVGATVNTFDAPVGARVGPVIVPFIFGEPFLLGFRLTVLGAPTPTTLVGDGRRGAWFDNTLRLTGLVPMDLAGDAPAAPSFVSASGTDYSVAGVVPEPGGLAFLALGVGVWISRVRKSRSRAA